MNTDHDRNDLDPKLAQRFDRLREIPPRNLKRTTDGRAAFLAQARDLAQKSPHLAPVSPSSRERLILWMRAIPEVFKRKEIQPMFTKVMAVLIAAVLVFSGAAATAYASQGSLPTDALYGVKTFGENLRLSLAPQADDKLGLALEFTQRRVDEISALAGIGLEIPAHVAAQYREQVEYTLRLAAGLSDDQIVPALEQIRTQLHEQLRIMEQLHQANPNDPALIQAREQLREQLRLAEAGLENPQRFREQIHNRERQVQETEEPPTTEEPGNTVPPGPGNENNNANENGNENGNTIRNTNGNGPGNTVGNENGNGNGNANDDNSKGNGNANDDDDNGNGGNGNDDNGGGGHGNDDDDNGGGGHGNDDDDNGGGGNGDDDGGGGNGDD